jgi:hypothetical protein
MTGRLLDLRTDRGRMSATVRMLCPGEVHWMHSPEGTVVGCRKPPHHKDSEVSDKRQWPAPAWLTHKPSLPGRGLDTIPPTGPRCSTQANNCQGAVNRFGTNPIAGGCAMCKTSRTPGRRGFAQRWIGPRFSTQLQNCHRSANSCETNPTSRSHERTVHSVHTSTAGIRQSLLVRSVPAPIVDAVEEMHGTSSRRVGPVTHTHEPGANAFSFGPCHSGRRRPGHR